jgi:hypothetical protein
MDLRTWLALQWDRVAAWVAVLAGAVALIVGWVGVSGTAYQSEQIPYIVSGGIGGMFLLGLGGMLWLSADMRDEWYKLDSVEEELRLTRAAGVALLSNQAPSAVENVVETPELELVAVRARKSAGA